MSKKKRNKAYKGSSAAMSRPQITRVHAVNRSKPRQWWIDNSRVAKPVLMISGIALLVIILIVGIVGIFI